MNDMSENSQIETIIEALQQAGYRLTAARQAIITALIQSGAHISANLLVELVRTQAPQVGRMTVYRTLDLLCALGILRPVYQGTGAAHYILLDNGHHHHLICSNCDRVVEFDECFLHELQAHVGNQFNFAVQGHLLELYGLCEACQEK